MRAFRARLQDVSKDLEAQRSRKGEHSTELQARHRRVVAELHEAQELAQTFDRKNQQLAAENQKLLEKLRTREDDRQALLKELVLSRKESGRLRQQVKEGGERENVARTTSANPEQPEGRDISFTIRQVDQAKAMENRNRHYEREVGYREAVKKLKRMVEIERTNAREKGRELHQLLQQRSELEVLLQQCLDDVKAEIVRQQDESAGPKLPPVEGAGANLSVHDLSAQDRERILELLLSQQRVVQLLYSKTFPNKPPDPPPPEEPKDKDDFSWLGDIIPPER